MDSAKLWRALRLSVADGALATAMGTLTGGIFLTGFALALEASRSQIGMIAAIPALANVAQIAGSYFIERRGERKRLCLWTAAIARLLWLLVAAIPLVASDFSRQGQVFLIILLLAVISVLSSISGVAWLSWTRDLVPESIRVRFFSRRHQINTVLALTISMLGGLFIDRWHSHYPGSLTGFVMIVVFAVLAGIGSLVLLAAIPEPAASQEVHRPPFGQLLALPLREANFRRVVLFYACWNLSVNIAAPFFAVFMLQKLQLPFWYVAALATLSSLAGVVSTRFWTRLSEKFGQKPVVFLATLGDALVPLLWVFISRDWAWALVLVHLSGVLQPATSNGPNHIVLKLAPQRNASPYMAVFSAIVGLTGLAAVVGGFVSEWLIAVEWSLGPVSIGGLKVVFLISCAGRLASLLLLHGIVEPRSQSVRHVVTVMRRINLVSPSRWLAPARRRRFDPAHAPQLAAHLSRETVQQQSVGDPSPSLPLLN